MCVPMFQIDSFVHNQKNAENTLYGAVGVYQTWLFFQK